MCLNVFLLFVRSCELCVWWVVLLVVCVFVCLVGWLNSWLFIFLLGWLPLFLVSLSLLLVLSIVDWCFFVCVLFFSFVLMLVFCSCAYAFVYGFATWPACPD